MRVLFLTHSFPRQRGDPPGSFVLRLASALRGEGFDTRVVAPAAPGYPEHATLDDVPVDRFHYAPRRFETLAYTGTMASQVQASWSARFTLLGFLGAEFRSAVRARREFKPDVVHAHWWFPNGLVGTWLGRLANKPLVTTLHGSDVRLARSVALARPAFRHVLHRSAAVTAVSRWLASEVQEVISAPAPVVAPMPVATELFSPDGVASRGNRLLFVGRLNKQKGIELLLHVMTKLADPSMGLDVVGDGEDRERLLQLAAGLGLDTRVTWHGAVPQDKLAAFYRRAVALVVPSIEEGLGLVAVEAQLCGTPVVAFASGGLTDVVQDDRTGILVPDVDAAALAAAITSLLSRDDRGASLGAAGRMHALATFAPESVARRYADVYKSAIAASPR
ncbi:MAG TPA: glycosyltransferase [Gemmatimonadaceae bacterium]|jgi:glycosyltransferase involved in cell wall biosynthesis|nr:glycosyltransferase [Gemmatimonadaceae bacterium]